MPIRLHRRTMLRGAFGVGVGLPWLECMAPKRASAQALVPTRYGVVTMGMALGADAWEKNSSMVGGERFTEAGHYMADTTLGRDFELTTPLRPLQALRSDFSMVSNLAIPFSMNSTEASAVPAGGAYRDFHGGGCSPLLSGTRSTSANFTCNGITSDQVIANLHDGETVRKSLVLRAQPSWYLSGSSYSGRQYISYSGAGNAGRIEAQDSPQVAYMDLFGSFVPAGDDDRARLDFELRARRSVLDLILQKRNSLVGRVGRADKIRLEQHFDAIRDLENRIAAMPTTMGGACIKPASPGTDPAVGGNNTGSGSNEIVPGLGYSGEHERARAMADLIHMAFVCDLTRVATLQLSVFQSHMNVLPISEGIGSFDGTTRPSRWDAVRADLHEVGHNGDQNNRGAAVSGVMQQWHVSHYAYLMAKLKSTPEGDGSVLDHCALVFSAEAGHGLQLNDASTANQTHSVQNMVMLVGGRGGGLQAGQHIDGVGAHPARCLVSAMQAAGYTGDSLGEVTGTITGLRS